MKIKIVLLSALAGLAMKLSAQSSIDNVLAEIAKNNKSIIANNQNLEAQRLTFKTGLTPDNPKVEYDYLPGTPAGAGTQRDFSITQGFDFPTVYGKRVKVSDEQIAKSQLEADVARQQVLLEAKHYCLELIYRNKMNAELTRRYNQSGRVHAGYKKMFDNGQANVLDMNKASLQLISIKTDLHNNETEREQLLYKLNELNGGNEVVLADTLYSPPTSLPSFEEVDSLAENTDPIVKLFKKDRELAQRQIEATQSLMLPKIEAGYHSQSILGQQYQGAHFGITVPLWENKNKVKAEKANLLYSELKINEHRTEHYFRIKKFYEKYQNLNEVLTEYQDLQLNKTNAEYLLKALEKGEISAIQYFLELSYFYAAYDRYLLTELESQKVLASLFRFQL
jgi:outer membrane protein TolC